MLKILVRVGWRLWLVGAVMATGARAAPPAELAAALHHLLEQRSYSWESINGDPGIVEQEISTRRGVVTSLQQSTAPHVLGSLTSTGDTLLRRDWTDGLQMDTLRTAGGDILTKTPEGWMTTREILDALADEQVHSEAPTERYTWLKRADRPRDRRPDQELAVLLRNSAEFEVSGDAYVSRLQLGPDSQDKSSDDSAPPMSVTFTLHLSDGVIRTYEIKIETVRSTIRGHVTVPVSEDRLVIINYLPVTKLDVPEEAWSKLKSGR